MRGRGNHTHLVPALCQPRGHVTGVFAHTGKLGGKVQTVDEQFHTKDYGACC